MKWRSRVCGATATDRPLRRTAGSESVFFYAHRNMIASFPHDRAFDIECEPYAMVQTSRPVDGSFNELPWQ
jgi:hypothetical protein